jgi:hypothetical protein
LPYFWDMTPDTLPRPDLNPLANPALERNLSRWAEVYFGNPPGQREEAVNRLLQEIKNETSEILEAERARRKASPPTPESRSVKTSAETMAGRIRFAEADPAEVRSSDAQDVSCPVCRHRNPPEHQFCGQCGGGLTALQSRSRASSLFPPVEQVDERVSARPENEVQWLRERSLGHLYEAEAPAWRGWKYLLGVVMIALAGLGYVQWNMSHPAQVVPTVAAPTSSLPGKTSSASVARSPAVTRSVRDQSVRDQSVSDQPVPNQSVSNLATHGQASKLSEVQPAAGTPEAGVQDRKVEQAGIQPALKKPSFLGATATPRQGSSGDSANADLLLAQRYLGGSMGVRDSAEAAKLLWKAVGKQDATAAILLSGLYARGDGVPKSCDQARLLLVAATKHGATQAAQQLREMERRGCQ